MVLLDMKRSTVNHLPLLTMAAAFLFALGPSGAARVLASPPAQLLAVSGPTDADVHTVGLWYEHHIPARFRARQAVSVSMLTGPEMGFYLNSQSSGDGSNDSNDDGDIDGVFENDPPCITLRLSDDGKPDTLTFAHEYGHYVWFDLLSDADRKHYEAVYDRQKAAHRLITDYAADCVQEGFAEAFSYFIAEPSVLSSRDPLSFQFLAQWQGR